VSPFRSRGFWLASVAFAAVAVPALLLYLWLNPADRVVVTVTRIDPSTRLLCLVAETPDGPQAMWWSLEKVVPFSMHPSDGPSNYNPESDRGRVTRDVSWRDGRRYGVLTRDEDDAWWVYWFGPDEVHLEWKYWPGKGGRAEIRLPAKGHAEPASVEFLDGLGFDAEARESYRERGGR
jgi:hypothetical protein